MIHNYPGKKTYVAEDMRKAMQLIQNDLGTQALVLSSKTIDNGVCIEAALPHVKPRSKIAEKIQTALTDAGFENNYCQKIVDQISEQQNFDRTMITVCEQIARDIPIQTEEIIDHVGAVALVGPTGVGKTTTTAKLAARFLTRHGKDEIGLISSDFYQVGGREQLRQYGKILDVPVHIVSNVHDLEESLFRLRKKRLILIDTAGISTRDVRLTQKLNFITHAKIPLKMVSVFSATSHSKMISYAIKVFRSQKLSGTIITKLDEYAQIGHVLCVCIENNLPISYISTGQNVPDDLKIAKRTELVQHAMQLETKIKELA